MLSSFHDPLEFAPDKVVGSRILEVGLTSLLAVDARSGYTGELPVTLELASEDSADIRSVMIGLTSVDDGPLKLGTLRDSEASLAALGKVDGFLGPGLVEDCTLIWPFVGAALVDSGFLELLVGGAPLDGARGSTLITN